jgi:hypothetical protein
MISKTLSPENQLKIKCPVFHAETKIAACFMLRDMVWRGEGPLQRQGCQCAMAAGKCPVPHILTKMVRTNEDNYHSVDINQKAAQIDYETMDRIAPVLVSDAMMRRYSLSALEEKAFAQGNEDARTGKHKTSKKPRRIERVMEDVQFHAEAPKHDAATSATIEAAKTGDFAAAINI